MILLSTFKNKTSSTKLSFLPHACYMYIKSSSSWNFEGMFPKASLHKGVILLFQHDCCTRLAAPIFGDLPDKWSDQLFKEVKWNTDKCMYVHVCAHNKRAIIDKIYIASHHSCTICSWFFCISLVGDPKLQGGT